DRGPRVTARPLPIVLKLTPARPRRETHPPLPMAWLFGQRYLDWLVGTVSQTVVSWSARCPACPACPQPPACPACPAAAPIHFHPPAACPAAPKAPAPAPAPQPVAQEPEGLSWTGGWLTCFLVAVNLLVFSFHVVRMAQEQAPPGVRRWAWAQYAGAPLWHQRRVWGRVIQDPTDARWSPLRVLISTPDGDVYEELYDMSDGTLAAVRFEDDRRTRPAGLEVGNLYRFRRALTAAEEVAIRNEVDAYARDVFLDAERAAGRPGVVPPAGAAVYFTFAAAAGGAVAPGPAPAAPAAGGGAAVAAALAVVPAGPAAPAAGPPAGAAPVAAAAAPLAAAGAPAGPLGPNAVPGADGQWVYVETTTTARRGDPVTMDGTELVRGAIGLKQDAGGSWSAIRLITTSQASYRGAEALADARLQPVALLSDGSRQRVQFHESVDRLREEPFPDWPLDGPRTTLWCLRFLDRKRGGAIEHFHQFASYYRLSRDDFGVTHYESIMRMVDYLMTWDLLDLPNVVGVEVMLRQAQLYEYMYAMEYEARDSGVSAAVSAEGEPKAKAKGKRLHRTSHRREMVVDAIRAMNEMYTGSSCPRPTGLTGPTTAQQEALAVIQEAVDAFGVPPPDLTPAGALEELRVAQSYDQESAVIAPVTFDRVDLISLPSVGSEPKSLSALIGDDSMSIGHRLQELLLPRERGLARVAEHAPKRAYSDPNLRNPRLYKKVLHRLVSSHLVEFHTDALSSVGMFFVYKKSGALRLILDGRIPSQLFDEPPKVKLATGAAFSQLRVDSREPVCVAGVDIADAFYTMLLPPWLRRYFGLPKIRAGELGISVDANGRPVAPTQWVHPCFRCPPMGFSLSLWLCQSVNEIVSRRAGLVRPERVLVDRLPAPVVDSGVVHTEYVDNFVALSLSEASAIAAARQVDHHMRAVGLPTHGVESGVGGETLGWSFDSNSPVISLNPRLRWKLYLGIQEVLRRGFCSGKEMVRIVSHITSRVLIRRELLSCLGAVYKFGEVYHNRTVPDGPEVSDVDPSFEEVPPDIWRDHWHPVLSVPWRRPAPQVILEARSGVMALKHKLRSKRSFRKAHVMLNDAMAPILALAKGRSSAPALLAVCRQVACLLLASGSAAYWRWLPSEFNSADPASRNRPGARRPAAAPAAPAPTHLGRRSRSQSAAALSWGDQADRRVARRRAFPAANTAATSGSLTFLETQAVGEATRRDYADRVSKFTARATSVRLPIVEVPELDVALVTFFNQLFFDGYPSEEATKYMAALAHCRAAPGRLQVAFPRAARAAKGWARLVPPRSRLPLPWPIACLMIDWMLDAGETTAAAATAVCFALYLRPAELLSLTREQVIPPAEGAPPGRTFLNFWSVVLHPMECAQPSKTGVYDEGLLLDSPEFTWLPPLLQALRARAAPGGRVFDMSYNQWALVFRRAATALHLGVLGPPTLYTLRHGGASHEYLAKFRSLDEIKKRGRWVSDSSLRRYTKGGRVAEQMRRLPISEQRHATRL
ncbi:unnamed protein product, partial [Prorocentrum cordatum]